MKDKINPNLKRLAELTCNPELAMPDLEEIVEKQTNQLERDAQGKPTIKLTPLEKTVVHTPTQESCDTLMQVYECGGWEWTSRTLQTSNPQWEDEEIYVTGGYDLFTKEINKFGYSHGKEGRRFYLSEGYKILSTKEFYNKQNITDDMIKEINKYFENKK